MLLKLYPLNCHFNIEMRPFLSEMKSLSNSSAIPLYSVKGFMIEEFPHTTLLID